MGPPLTSGNVCHTTGPRGVFILHRDTVHGLRLSDPHDVLGSQQQVVLSTTQLVAADRLDREAALQGRETGYRENLITRAPGRYGRAEVEDLLVDLEDAGVVAENPWEEEYRQDWRTCRLNVFQEAAMVDMLEEYDADYLEAQMDKALAQYNDSGVDMGNDPVGSGRRIGLLRVAALEREWAALPKLPPETGGSEWTLLYVMFGAIAFTYLYRYLTRR